VIIIGAAMNHRFHMDMNYRAVINMLVFCGCVGQSGGGWAHDVGQEKLRPQTGWTALAFALDWARPPRHMNSTSTWYAHANPWRHETISATEILSPTAPKGDWNSLSVIDYNIRAERMGWLPPAPQLRTNPLTVGAAARAEGIEAKDLVARGLKAGALEMTCKDPVAPRKTGRGTCSCGGRTCWGPRARGKSISSSTFWAPITGCWARTWARTGGRSRLRAR